MAGFNWASGTNGFSTAPFNILSSELNGLAAGNTALSSVGGTSGTFSRTETGADLFGSVAFVSGGAFTPSANAYIEGWFLTLGDNTTAEKFISNAAQARSPDWIIRLHAALHAAGDVAVCQGGIVRLPAMRWKTGIRILNATLPASGNKIMLGGVEVEVL